MPRTSKSDVTNLVGDRVYQEFTDGVLSYSSTTSRPLLDRTESRTTNNTLDFRSYRTNKSGLSKEDLPMNPFSYALNSYSHAYGQVIEELSPSVKSVETGVIALGENFIERGITTAKRNDIAAAALQKSLLDLKDKKVDLGVMYAERAQTGKLLVDSVTNFTEAFRAARRGNVSAALDALSGNSAAAEAISKRSSSAIKKVRGVRQSSSDVWLQLQYGWKPLLSDVYNSVEAVARQSNRPARFRVSSSKSYRWNNPEMESYQGLPVLRSETGIYTRKYVYVFSYSNEVIHSLSELGLTNPALIAWELLPYSFVADWFVGVGNYLDTLDATLGLTFEKGCVTDFERITIGYHGNRSGIAPATGRYVRHNFKARRKYVYCNRVPLTGFPSADMPKFDFTPKSVTHGVSFAALVSQRVKPIREALSVAFKNRKVVTE